MKRSLLPAVLLAVAVLPAALAPTALAQDRLARDPGYLDLSFVDAWFRQPPSVEVNVKGALLTLVAEASRYDDPELSDLLRKLKAIQVRTFALPPGQHRGIEQRTAELAQRLENQGWDAVVRVRDGDERVHMFVKTAGSTIAGMVVMVIDPQSRESVFLNIVGDIDPEQIGRIGRQFDIGPLQGTTTRRHR